MKGLSSLRRPNKASSNPNDNSFRSQQAQEISNLEQLSDGSEDEDDDDLEGGGSEGIITLDEFEANIDQRVSVLKAAGLVDFLEALTEFGFETIEDLLEPGLVNDEDLMSESIGMTTDEVTRFRHAIGDYRRALENLRPSFRMSGHFR